MSLKKKYQQLSVPKGTTILTAKPFAYVLRSSYRRERCSDCLESGKLLKCSACEYVYYCNRSCQRKSWNMHKRECAHLKRLAPQDISDTTHLMARVIIKLNQGGSEEISYYSDTGFKRFKDLMSHQSDIKQDKDKMDYFGRIFVFLLLFFKDEPLKINHLLNGPELLGIFGRICINAFHIYDVDMNNTAIAIYLAPSILDHSCKPNLAVTFEGTTIIIRTIKDFPCLDWSQFRVSYIDTLKTTKDRRAELLSTYYFWCNCEKCEEPEPMAEAAACPNKLCTYPCSPDADACENCNTKFPEDFRETFEEVSELTAHHLRNMTHVAYFDACQVCLKKQEGVLHSFNIQHLETLQNALDSCITLQHFEGAEVYAEELINGYLMYYGEINPHTGTLYLLLSKIQRLLGKTKKAVKTFKRAAAILNITHEGSHTMMQKYLKPLASQTIK